MEVAVGVHMLQKKCIPTRCHYASLNYLKTPPSLIQPISVSGMTSKNPRVYKSYHGYVDRDFTTYPVDVI